MRRHLVSAFLLTILAICPVSARTLPLLPTPENLAGQWLGFDCTARVWRIDLGADGTGLVVFSALGQIKTRVIVSSEIRGRKLSLTLVAGSLAEMTLRGPADVDKLSLGIDGSSSCPIRFRREATLQSELDGTAAALHVRP